MPALIPLAVSLAASAAVDATIITAFQAALIVGATALVVNSYATAKARRDARDAFNSQLADNLVMTSTADGDRSWVYGRSRNSDGVLLKFTHGLNNKFYTLFIAGAGHEVDAIETVYFDNLVCALDVDGYVTTAPYNKLDLKNYTSTSPVSGGNFAISIPYSPVGLSAILQFSNSNVEGGGDSVQVAVTVSGSGASTVVSGNAPTAGTMVLTYQGSLTASKARVRKYLGSTAQSLYADLSALAPAGMFVSTDRLSNIGGVLCTFEYDQDVFPNGIPNVSMVMRGAKVLDTRTGVTQWTENPSLNARHWALNPWGGGLSTVDLDEQSFKDAANDCEVSTAFTITYANATQSQVVTAPRYTSGMVCHSGSDPYAQFQELIEAMAGKVAWPGSALRIRAGAYRAPVAPIIDETWLSGAGDIQIVQEPPMDDAVNITRPTIANAMPRNATTGVVDLSTAYAAVPMAEVRAESYITADQRELPQDTTYSAITDEYHGRHVSEVLMREARNGLTAVLPCNFKAFKMEMFDVVRVSIDRFGWAQKIFEVTGWAMEASGGVILTLKETTSDIFTVGLGFPVGDQTPNTNLPNPAIVGNITNLAAATGTAQLIKGSDGTIFSRFLVTWAQVSDAAVIADGQIEIRYGKVGVPEANWQSLYTNGADTQLYIDGIDDGEFYNIKARASNALVTGKWCTQIVVRAVGKQQPPVDVVGFSTIATSQGLLFQWNADTEVDYLETEVRVGNSWTDYTRYFIVSGSSLVWPTAPAGTFNAFAKHRDTSRNVSTGTASISVTVSAAQALAWQNIVGRPTQFRVYTGGFGAALAGKFTASIGISNPETGSYFFGGVRSYMMVLIDRATATINFLNSYDMYDSAQQTRFGNDLGNVRVDQICVVYTYDEPQYGRLTASILAGMKRNGASTAVFGSPQFKYRSAYCLVGIGACGEGNGFESYQGSVDNDSAAIVDIVFQIQFGQLLVTGSGATPRTLADYSYIGDLNATNGAIIGVNLGGQITASNAPALVADGSFGTPQLALGAATEVINVSYNAGNLYNPAGNYFYWYDLAPPVDCIAVMTARFSCTWSGGTASGNGARVDTQFYAGYITIAGSTSGTASVRVETQQITFILGTGEMTNTYTMTASFSLVAGVAYRLGIEKDKRNTSIEGSILNSAIKIELIKR